jgi:hypothetical protein
VGFEVAPIARFAGISTWPPGSNKWRVILSGRTTLRNSGVTERKTLHFSVKETEILMNKNTPYYAAFLRALIVGIVGGASTFLTTWSTTNDVKAIGIAVATAFLAPFLTRFGGEGAYDTNRDTKITRDGASAMNATDVGFTAAQGGAGY